MISAPESTMWGVSPSPILFTCALCLPILIICGCRLPLLSKCTCLCAVLSSSASSALSVCISLLLSLLLPTSKAGVPSHGLLLPGLLPGEGYGVPPPLVLLSVAPRSLAGDLPLLLSCDCPRPLGARSRSFSCDLCPASSCVNLHLSPNLHLPVSLNSQHPPLRSIGVPSRLLLFSVSVDLARSRTCLSRLLLLALLLSYVCCIITP